MGLSAHMGRAMSSDQLSHSAEAALRERVKELTCLYEIAQIAARPGILLEEILRDIVEVVRRAWQYPEITCARIALDGRAYLSEGFREGAWKQAAEIVVAGRGRGTVEVTYVEDRPRLDEGPFLKEERSLIDAVAGRVALIVERREAEQDRSRLHDQLRHADRLATIGQLAAGVAHELNEPLGNILGFAQLAKKCPALPAQAKGDIEKIEAASLHARETIKKLLVFARQTSPQRRPVQLNRLIEEGLHFFKARCAKEGIELVLALSPGLPEITADPAQLNQVLVNLVVNALQAMPGGGTLTVRTRPRVTSGEGHISLVVEDTGTGMSEDVIEKLFVPFFTTKDVGEGTGLGLPVAHGIVTSHGGSIRVESALGRGTRFEIKLPLAGSGAVGEST
jgi:signal transduction histidine kinase